MIWRARFEAVDRLKRGKDIESFIDDLKHGRWVASLNIDGLELGDTGVRRILEKMESTSIFDGINVSSNAIGNNGALAIAEGIRQNPKTSIFGY